MSDQKPDPKMLTAESVPAIGASRKEVAAEIQQIGPPDVLQELQTNLQKHQGKTRETDGQAARKTADVKAQAKNSFKNSDVTKDTSSLTPDVAQGKPPAGKER